MSTVFTKLNNGWNAEPNAPDERVEVNRNEVALLFLMDPYRFSGYAPDDIGILRFANCWRYRLGATNDEGWYRGQCRFSGIASEWGEFYELSGDLRADEIRGKWNIVGDPVSETRHFLFYLKDSTFECDAGDWRLTIQRA